MTEPAQDLQDEPVPKLPRGRGMRFSGPQMFRILVTLGMLVAVIALAKPCSNAVSGFVTGFGSGGGSALPKPGAVDVPKPDAIQLDQYEHLRPNMTDEELRAAVQRAKARNIAATPDAAGSAAP